MSDEISIAERMERLERRANVVRSRLVNAVEALDQRRHQVVKVSKAMTQPKALIGVAAAVGIGALAIGLFAFGRRKKKPFGERLLEEISAANRPSFARRALERTALTLLSVGVAELARRGAKNAFDGRLLDGRIAIGHALEAHHES